MVSEPIGVPIDVLLGLHAVDEKSGVYAGSLVPDGNIPEAVRHQQYFQALITMANDTNGWLDGCAMISPYRRSYRREHLTARDLVTLWPPNWLGEGLFDTATALLNDWFSFGKNKREALRALPLDQMATASEFIDGLIEMQAAQLQCCTVPSGAQGESGNRVDADEHFGGGKGYPATPNKEAKDEDVIFVPSNANRSTSTKPDSSALLSHAPQERSYQQQRAVSLGAAQCSTPGTPSQRASHYANDSVKQLGPSPSHGLHEAGTSSDARRATTGTFSPQAQSDVDDISRHRYLGRGELRHKSLSHDVNTTAGELINASEATQWTMSGRGARKRTPQRAATGESPSPQSAAPSDISAAPTVSPDSVSEHSNTDVAGQKRGLPSPFLSTQQPTGDVESDMKKLRLDNDANDSDQLRRRALGTARQRLHFQESVMGEPMDAADDDARATGEEYHVPSSTPMMPPVVEDAPMRNSNEEMFEVYAGSSHDLPMLEVFQPSDDKTGDCEDERHRDSFAKDSSDSTTDSTTAYGKNADRSPISTSPRSSILDSASSPELVSCYPTMTTEVPSARVTPVPTHDAGGITEAKSLDELEHEWARKAPLVWLPSSKLRQLADATDWGLVRQLRTGVYAFGGFFTNWAIHPDEKRFEPSLKRELEHVDLFRLKAAVFAFCIDHHHVLVAAVNPGYFREVRESDTAKEFAKVNTVGCLL